jgi:hypothetical protein
MVGNRNHPLNQRHYDEDTLEEFVLGQLLPDEEAQIRQHVEHCPLCRATVADIRAFCHRISSELRHDLERAEPGPQLSFDRIASAWRKPPRRVTLLYKLQQHVPSASYLLLVVLLATAFIVLFPSPNTAALDSLALANTYDGPPAVVAAMTEQGLVIIKLDAGGADILTHLSTIRDPRDLKFSPDGQWLAFQDRSTLNIIRTMDDDVRIRVYVHETAEWSWSPDGQKLAYTNGTGQLAVFDVATQTNRVIVPAEESAWGLPVWTDDSAQIAYVVTHPLPTDPAQGTRVHQGIWRITLATGYRVELARNSQPDGMLLVPADWSSDNTVLLAWDRSAETSEERPALYRINVKGHTITPVQGQTVAQGTQLAWPVSSQDMTLAFHYEELRAIYLTDEANSTLIPEQMPWPQSVDWAPNGAWMAYTVTGSAEGRGVFLYAPQKAELRPIQLPGGATEKAVVWAGAEHLFVVRQPTNTFFAELWMVPLTTNEPALRVMTDISLPHPNGSNGWLWQDVLATQVIHGGN